MTVRFVRWFWLGAAMLLVAPALAIAQGGQQPAAVREANRLDSEGKTAEARAIFQRIIDTASAQAAKAAAQRGIAISYGFDGDCANAAKYEEMVIGYWATREQAEPQNAFYQQGEMANEAARVCIDAGELDVAERWYRRGTELGLREPSPKSHAKSLWEFRLAHANARIAARRGQRADAMKHVAEARRILDADTAMARAQERFFPYLAGYVALYSNDLPAAKAELSRALSIQGNQGDPFMHVLLAMTYEKLNEGPAATALYEKAYELATAHNPPAAFSRPFTRKKLGR